MADASSSSGAPPAKPKAPVDDTPDFVPDAAAVDDESTLVDEESRPQADVKVRA